MLDCFQYSQWTISISNANAHNNKYKQHNTEIGSINIIESVDSISRDGPECHICNTLQIPKYLKIGNFVKC